MRKKHAFTLAEVLIALAILGVVVLLVISGVKTSQNEAHLYSAQYDKVYNDVFTASQSVLNFDRKGTLMFSSEENLRDAFQGRLDVASTWDNGEGWVDNGEGIINAMASDASVSNLSGVTLSNGVSLGFLDGSSLSPEAKNDLANGNYPGGSGGSGGGSSGGSGGGSGGGSSSSIVSPVKETISLCRGSRDESALK